MVGSCHWAVCGVSDSKAEVHVVLQAQEPDQALGQVKV